MANPDDEDLTWLYAITANQLDLIERQIAALKATPLRGVLFIAITNSKTLDQQFEMQGVTAGKPHEVAWAIQKIWEDIHRNMEGEG